jgi:5-methyltetrahydropteroyltriglutamate--homocysteine methyltransferase
VEQSRHRILTTHVGSLVRPPEMVEILQRKEDGKPFSDGERVILARNVAEAVRMQAACGIDIASDGEYSKTGFSQYITDRLTGFELRTDLPGRGGGTARSRDRKRFADAYREIEGSSQNAPTSTGQPQLQMVHTGCTGPSPIVAWRPS